MKEMRTFVDDARCKSYCRVSSMMNDVDVDDGGMRRRKEIIRRAEKEIKRADDMGTDGRADNGIARLTTTD